MAHDARAARSRKLLPPASLTGRFLVSPQPEPPRRGKLRYKIREKSVGIDGIDGFIARMNAVHLCVDMQNLFAPGRPWATPWMQKALPSIVRLAGRSPERTMFTRFIPPGSPSDARGMWREYYKKWSNVTRDRISPELLGLVPELRKFVPPATVIDRMVYSTFGGGRLLEFLMQRHIDTLIISGGETDVLVRRKP